MALDGFWVYEDWSDHHITIHRSNCARCNDGRGQHPERETGSWLWHGRFGYLGAAWWFAENRTVQSSRAKGVRNCSQCMEGVAAPPDILKTPPDRA